MARDTLRFALVTPRKRFQENPPLFTAANLQPASVVRCVYGVRMARVNVYLPDELADEARAAGLNVSAVAQAALRAELAGQATSAWVRRVAARPGSGVAHERVVEVLDAVRSDEGDEWPPERRPR